jgi:hypothetical protein
MADAEVVRAYEVQAGDFGNAGKASTSIKDTLKDLGLAAPLVRRVAIAPMRRR